MTQKAYALIYGRDSNEACSLGKYAPTMPLIRLIADRSPPPLTAVFTNGFLRKSAKNILLLLRNFRDNHATVSSLYTY